MAPRKPASPDAIFQLKVALKRHRPPIWRRLQLRSDTQLSTLHEIIQDSMGWWDGHLHEFEINGVRYGQHDPIGWTESIDERQVTLNQLGLRERTRFSYQYDFGDDWQHEVLVEKVLPPEPYVRYPICIAGKRACPPEDVGGVWGYTAFLEAVSDPRHPEHQTWREWIGREFDPELFNLDAVNAWLQHIR